MESTEQAKPDSGRVVGLDVYRGLVIAAMFFVNYLAGMDGVPHLLQHEAPGIDHFTLADLVFPAFLLMVGVSVPLGLGRRLERGEPVRKTLLHVGLRTVALLVLGVATVEYWAFDAAATGLSSPTWHLLFYLAVFLVWIDPKPISFLNRGRRLLAARILGIALLALLFAIVRYDYQDGVGPTTIRTSWWGILGIIGWCYLPNALVWYAVKRRQMKKGSGERRTLLWLGALFGAETLLYCVVHALDVDLQTFWLGCAAVLLSVFPDGSVGGVALGAATAVMRAISWICDKVNVPVLFGSHAALTTAGVFAGELVSAVRDGRKRLRFWALEALLLVLLGQFLRTWQVANKIDGTASWCLLTAGIALFGLALCCAALELKPARTLLGWAGHVGSTAMLAYVLPEIFSRILDASAVLLCPAIGWPEWDYCPANLWNLVWPWWSDGGAKGIFNAVLVAALVASFAAFCGKKRIRLKL